MQLTEMLGLLACMRDFCAVPPPQIFWIILTFALLILAGLRKLALPHLIKGDRTVSIICVFLQFVTFVLLLAALALDQWSTTRTHKREKS